MKRFIVALFVLVLFVIPAHALMSFGDIPGAPGMEYDDLKIQGNYVYVTIENNNSRPVRFAASLSFASLRDEILGETFIDISIIPPGGEAKVKSIILQGDPAKIKKANKLYWILY